MTIKSDYQHKFKIRIYFNMIMSEWICKNVNKIHDKQKHEAMQLALGLYPEIEVQKAANVAVVKKISIFSIKPFVNKKGILEQTIGSSECIETEFVPMSSNQYKGKASC